MTARLPVYGTSVQARPASDAVEGVTCTGLGENSRAAVIEQDGVKLLRPITGRYASPDGVVGIHAFARRRARQQLKKNFEILIPGDYFLDADDADKDLRKRQTHPAVSF